MYDLHTHFVPENVLEWIKENPTTVNASFEKKDKDKNDFLIINNKWGFELKDTFISSEKYLKAQQKTGVTHSLISPIPQLFLYDFPNNITKHAASLYNKGLAKWARNEPERISALGTVPLNDPNQAAIELNESISNGLKGAIIAPMCNNKMITDDFFTPFWEEANKLNSIVFIHPLLNEDSRIKKRKMPNLIGVPWETTVCATDILLSGMLDKYPNVKILLAHGGGFFPYQIGRINKGYEMWKEVSQELKYPPETYLKQFWFDSVLFDERSLQFLKSIVGEEKVVPGSDFPFDLAAWPPLTNNKKAIHSLLFE